MKTRQTFFGALPESIHSLWPTMAGRGRGSTLPAWMTNSNGGGNGMSASIDAMLSSASAAAAQVGRMHARRELGNPRRS